MIFIVIAKCDVYYKMYRYNEFTFYFYCKDITEFNNLCVKSSHTCLKKKIPIRANKALLLSKDISKTIIYLLLFFIYLFQS